MTLDMTEAAAKQVTDLFSAEGKAGLMFRVAVTSGGCSGFQYAFTFDDQKTEEDHCFEHHGVTVVCDETSLELLKGSVIDYKQELIGSAFVLTNPNAASSCGCGSSFAL